MAATRVTLPGAPRALQHVPGPSPLNEFLGSIERLGAGIAALGETMQFASEDWVKADTFIGLGYLLEALGDAVINKTETGRKLVEDMAQEAQGGRHD